MIGYLRQQFLVNASFAAKKVMHHKAHHLKNHMPKHVSLKNARRITLLRHKKQKQSLVEQLKAEIETEQQTKKQLAKKVHELEMQIESYKKRVPNRMIAEEIAKEREDRATLQELISLERELIQKEKHLKAVYAAGGMTQKEFHQAQDQFSHVRKTLMEKRSKLLRK